MSILFELRYPTKWYTKLFTAIVAVVFFAGLATLAIAGFLVYRIVKPSRTSTEINMNTFPGRPDAVQFEVPAPNGHREGWFFPGFRGAPTIILCHGYESSRGELLTLVSALQEHQYNVFVFDFAAHGANTGVTTLGYREGDELRKAEEDKRIRALILDSVYDDPEQMVKLGVERSGLATFPLMIRSTQITFGYL